MNGWLSVAMIVATEFAAAALLVRATVRSWWDGLILAVLTVASIRPTLHHVTGDISRYLPDALWSGSDDKEQIIYASAASTILLPLIASAAAVFLYRRIRYAVLPDSDRQDDHPSS